MARLIGHSGTASIGGTDLQVTSWSLDIEQEELDGSYMGNGVKQFVPGGLITYSGSLEGTCDGAIMGTGTYPKPFAVTAQTGSFALSNASGTFTSTAVVTGKVSFKKGVGGLMTWTCDYKANDLTYTGVSS